MTRNAYETAGADRAAEDVRRVMTASTMAFWPGTPNRSTRLPADPELRRRWLAGYAEGMTRTLAGYVTSNEPEPDLRAHVSELHTRLRASGADLAELARQHADEHFRFGSRTHHHGPNPGPHARPAGWRTGGGVVRIDQPRQQDEQEMRS